MAAPLLQLVSGTALAAAVASLNEVEAEQPIYGSQTIHGALTLRGVASAPRNIEKRNQALPRNVAHLALGLSAYGGDTMGLYRIGVLVPLLLAASAPAFAQHTADGCMSGQCCPGAPCAAGTIAPTHKADSSRNATGSSASSAALQAAQEAISQYHARTNEWKDNDEYNNQPFPDLQKKSAELKSMQEQLRKQDEERQQLIEQDRERQEYYEKQSQERFSSLKNASQGQGDPASGLANVPAVVKDPAIDYTGRACTYFTRSGDDAHVNAYADGSWVAYGDRMYECSNRHWVSRGPKKAFTGYNKMEASFLEH